MILPEVVTPEELAERMGWGPRTLRQFARTLGACRILGNRMILTAEDVDAILEATKPPPEGPAPTVRELFRSARQKSVRDDHSETDQLLAMLEANRVRAKEERKEERRQAKIAERASPAYQESVRQRRQQREERKVRKVKLTPRTPPVDKTE